MSDDVTSFRAELLRIEVHYQGSNATIVLEGEFDTTGVERFVASVVSTGEVASVLTPAGPSTVGEVAVDHRHTHRTLARGGGHALHTVGPHVASGEDAWNAGLKREW
jgi:hypothetical protein